MITNGRELYNFLDSYFFSNGYKRKKDTYYFVSEECISFFIIRKSSVKNGYYENTMGVFVKQIMEEKTDFPLFYKSHINYSIRNFIEKEKAMQLFTLGNGIFRDEEREKEIQIVLQQIVFPFLMELSNLEGIKKSMTKYEDLKYYTKGTLIDLLSINT